MTFIGETELVRFRAMTAAVVTASLGFGSSDGKVINSHFGVCYKPVDGPIEVENIVEPHFGLGEGESVVQTVSDTIENLTPGEYLIGACSFNETTNTNTASATRRSSSSNALKQPDRIDPMIETARYVEAMSVVAEIRFATPAERAALGALHRRSSFVWEEDRASFEAHPEVFGVSPDAIVGRRVRVAVDEQGTVLGFSGVSDAGEGVCELDDLFVEPALMRGGVGTALVDDVVARHRMAGFREITVVAAPRTFGFYESVGFTVGEPVATRFGSAARLRRRLP